MTITLKFEAGLVPVIKHGTHDQKTHGNWAHGITAEIENWNPNDPIPASPKNAGGMTAKIWENWEHGPDGNQYVGLYRQLAGEALGIPVPKDPMAPGGYLNYLTQRGFGGSSVETAKGHAKAMLEAIANGSPTQPALYRGIVANSMLEGSEGLVKQLSSLKEGDTLDMPLVSTTRSLGVATWYAADRVSDGQNPIIMKIQPGARGVSVSAEKSFYPADHEVITSGKFEVVGVTKINAPYWKRGVFEPRKITGNDEFPDHYEVATYSDKRYSPSEAKQIWETVNGKGGIQALSTPTLKFTVDRESQSFVEGRQRVYSSWTKQEPKQFTVIEVKMIEPHRLQKSLGTDYGILFDGLFDERPFIDEFTEVQKHGTHDQSSHGNWSTGMMSESDLMDSYVGHELSAEEDSAVGRYLATGHRVNELVRTGQMEHYLTDETKVSDVVKGLDSAIDNAPALPKGELFRVVSADAIDRLRKGDVINDKGFMSTTAANLFDSENGALLLHLATVSSGRKSIMVITNNGGKKGLFMPAVKVGQPIAEHEREVVLPRNTKLKYKGEEYHFMENGMLTYYKFERQP